MAKGGCGLAVSKVQRGRERETGGKREAGTKRSCWRCGSIASVESLEITSHPLSSFIVVSNSRFVLHLQRLKKGECES